MARNTNKAIADVAPLNTDITSGKASNTAEHSAPERLSEGTLVWGDTSLNYTVTFADLPQATVLALAQRGFTHILGNEVAAYVANMKAKVYPAEAERAKRDGEDAVPMYDETELAVMAHDRRNAKVAEMLAGTIGQGGGARGPKLPTLERLMREIARETITARATALGKVKGLPKASDKAGWATMIDGFLDIPSLAADVKAEAERRMAPVADVAKDEFAALFAGLKA